MSITALSSGVLLCSTNCAKHKNILIRNREKQQVSGRCTRSVVSKIRRKRDGGLREDLDLEQTLVSLGTTVTHRT